MAVCESCIHSHVCKYGENRSNGMYCTGEKCKQYQTTADIAPRADVEFWQAIAEGYQQMLERQYEMHQAELAEIKAEVAREVAYGMVEKLKKRLPIISPCIFENIAKQVLEE